MLEAVFRVVTPLFLGDAERKGAEIRAASLKGALRFWYRATGFTANTDMERIEGEEGKLFGSSDRGQSSFLIDVVKTEIKLVEPGKKWGNHGVSYLGFGLLNYRGEQIERFSIAPGGRFRVRFYFRGKGEAQEKSKAALCRALQALNFFGGLGSRSRRGFGSVVLESLSIDGKESSLIPANAGELKEKIEGFCRSLGELTTGLPPYTAFSSQSKIVLFGERDNALDALENVGRELIRYRSYGCKDDARGYVFPWKEKVKRQNFKGDHDLIRNFAATGNAAKHPERVVFGLPHNYFFRDRTKVNVEGALDDYKRRASPLFIHIHKLQKGYVPVLTLLPAVFLPEGGRIILEETTKDKDNGRAIELPCSVGTAGYKVITNFLDNLPGKQEVKL